MAHELQDIEPLTGVSGELYGYLFENERFGIERNVFWNIVIRCAPVSYLGDRWEPAVLFDWLRTDCMTEKVLSSESRPDAEVSFYIASHDPAHRWSLQVEHDGDGVPRHGRFDLSVDFPGLDDDPLPDLRIVGSSPIKLTSVSVARDSLLPKPSSHADARAMIAPYFPAIEEWEPIEEEDEDGWPVPDPHSFRFSKPD